MKLKQKSKPLDGTYVLGFNGGLNSNSGMNQARSTQAVSAGTSAGTNRTFSVYSLLYYLCFTCALCLLRLTIFCYLRPLLFSPIFPFFSFSFIAPLILYYCLFSLSRSLSFFSAG